MSDENFSKAVNIIPNDYEPFLASLKADIYQSQIKAAQSITKELILLYWRIGKMISEKVFKNGWGAKTIERLAHDLNVDLLELSGFSYRNLKYMRQFAKNIVRSKLGNSCCPNSMGTQHHSYGKIKYYRAKNKDSLKVEYALRDIQKPMGIADYQVRLVESLPKELKGSLPSIEEIEAELERTLK